MHDDNTPRTLHGNAFQRYALWADIILLPVIWLMEEMWMDVRNNLYVNCSVRAKTEFVQLHGWSDDIIN